MIIPNPTDREPPFLEVESDPSGRILRRTWYAHEANGVFSQRLREELYTYAQPSRLVSLNIKTYGAGGSVESDTTYDYEVERVGANQIMRRKRR